MAHTNPDTDTSTDADSHIDADIREERTDLTREQAIRKLEYVLSALRREETTVTQSRVKIERSGVEYEHDPDLGRDIPVTARTDGGEITMLPREEQGVILLGYEYPGDDHESVRE